MSTQLTLEEAEKRAPYFSADWYRRQLRAGKIRGSKVGGRWFVEESAIEELFANGSNRPERTEASTRRRRRRAA
jgi:hypothetical protein